MHADDLRPISLFDGLSDDQLAELTAAGEEVAIGVGAELFHEGEHADFWWLLVEGAITLSRMVGDTVSEVGRMDQPGLWSGGFRAWNEHGVYLATGVGATPGRALRVPADALRELLNAWFPFGTHLVAGLYGTAHSIESDARQRESLITLGTLSAGLAHELNNPASAAVRAVDALALATATLQSSLGDLAAAEITAAQFRQLDSLRNEAAEHTVADLDPLALADAEDALAEWLDSHGVANVYEVAPSLVAAGLGAPWCDQVLDAVGTTALGAATRWVAASLTMAELLTEITESTGRVSRLVAAMRSHSQMDRAERQTVDVTDGLESTLLILGHKLRDGVTVKRDYAAGLPRIDAYPGELNQVWTNLIDNAIDAMDGVGTLTLAVRAESDALVVEVIDSGPGMSEVVQRRAFEAFFTTKDVGKGTGLGLDIAHRIVVDRHHGEIEIDSQPGRTIMRVRLPR